MTYREKIRCLIVGLIVALAAAWGYSADPQVYARLEWDYAPDVTVWSNSTGIVAVATNDFGPLTSVVSVATNKTMAYRDVVSVQTNAAIVPVNIGTNRYVVSVTTTNGIRSTFSKELIGTRKAGGVVWK
jgi:hypothetical protein